MKHVIYTHSDRKDLPVTPALRALCKKVITATLDDAEIDFPCEVSLTFTDNEHIRALNKEYRDKDAATDVLSFPQFENGELEYDEETGEPCALGDIVVSMERASEQADEYGHSLEREVGFLCCHSMLHLLGFDHETSKEDEIYMNDTCEEILSSLGLPRVKDEAEEAEEVPEKPTVDVKDMRTCFVSIMGRPNVGKSTLLNRLIGEKIAAVSKKPQTTRTRVTGICTRGAEQYVFIDTPGLHKPKNKLGEYMVDAAKSALPDADVVVLVVESGSKITPADREIVEDLKKAKLPAVLFINKTDIARKDILLLTIDSYSHLYDFSSIVPGCALDGEGTDVLMDELRPYTRAERWYYPEELITDQSERTVVSEIIREKLLRVLDEEIPHGTAVTVEDYTDKPDITEIRAEIYCEKEAHKKIIIGKNGQTLKKIATYAREDIENMIGRKCYLNLWVRVKENWRDSELNLSRLGFGKDDRS